MVDDPMGELFWHSTLLDVQMTKPDQFDDEREPLPAPRKTLKLSGKMRVVDMEPGEVAMTPPTDETPAKLFVADGGGKLLPLCPPGFFNLKVADHKVIIVDRAGDDWNDVMVWDRELRCSLHVHRRSITPTEDATAAIEFLVSLK